MVIHFGGSRSLVQSALLRQVISAALATGASIHVGCAVGADQQVISHVLCSGQAAQLSVFAAFSRSGAGSWLSSAVGQVQRAERLGASVAWLAGGALAVPLRARLMCRSLAALAGCSLSVFFLSPQGSAGSLAVAAQAVAQGIPVVVFCPTRPVLLAGQLGSWQHSQLFGFKCWQWQPAARLF